MLRKDVNEKIGAAKQINSIDELIKVLSIHFVFCKPFINFDGDLGFACEDVSVFLDIGGFNVAIGDEFHMASDITELNELITNRNK